MRRTKANRALTFVMAAALLIGSIHGVGAKEQSKAYDAPELTLTQGVTDYDLTEGITYDSEKYTLSVTDTGNFDINVAGDYEISYALMEKESSVSETESVENTESVESIENIESTETVSGAETIETTDAMATVEDTDQTPEGDAINTVDTQEKQVITFTRTVHVAAASEDEVSMYEARELVLVQGEEGYDLTDEILYDDVKYTLTVGDLGGFDINKIGSYEVTYSLTPVTTEETQENGQDDTQDNQVITFQRTVTVKAAEEETGEFEVPELYLEQGQEDYDLAAGLVYDENKYKLNIKDDGNFDIMLSGEYKVTFVLNPLEETQNPLEETPDSEGNIGDADASGADASNADASGADQEDTFVIPDGITTFTRRVVVTSGIALLSVAGNTINNNYPWSPNMTDTSVTLTAPKDDTYVGTPVLQWTNTNTLGKADITDNSWENVPGVTVVNKNVTLSGASLVDGKWYRFKFSDDDYSEAVRLVNSVPDTSYKIYAYRGNQKIRVSVKSASFSYWHVSNDEIMYASSNPSSNKNGNFDIWFYYNGTWNSSSYNGQWYTMNAASVDTEMNRDTPNNRTSPISFYFEGTTVFLNIKPVDKAYSIATDIALGDGTYTGNYYDKLNMRATDDRKTHQFDFVGKQPNDPYQPNQVTMVVKSYTELCKWGAESFSDAWFFVNNPKTESSKDAGISMSWINQRDILLSFSLTTLEKSHIVADNVKFESGNGTFTEPGKKEYLFYNDEVLGTQQVYPPVVNNNKVIEKIPAVRPNNNVEKFQGWKLAVSGTPDGDIDINKLYSDDEVAALKYKDAYKTMTFTAQYGEEQAQIFTGGTTAAKKYASVEQALKDAASGDTVKIIKAGKITPTTADGVEVAKDVTLQHYNDATRFYKTTVSSKLAVDEDMLVTLMDGKLELSATTPIKVFNPTDRKTYQVGTPNCTSWVTVDRNGDAPYFMGETDGNVKIDEVTYSYQNPNQSNMTMVYIPQGMKNNDKVTKAEFAADQQATIEVDNTNSVVLNGTGVAGNTVTVERRTGDSKVDVKLPSGAQGTIFGRTVGAAPSGGVTVSQSSAENTGYPDRDYIVIAVAGEKVTVDGIEYVATENNQKFYLGTFKAIVTIGSNAEIISGQKQTDVGYLKTYTVKISPKADYDLDQDNFMVTMKESDTGTVKNLTFADVCSVDQAGSITVTIPNVSGDITVKAAAKRQMTTLKVTGLVTANAKGSFKAVDASGNEYKLEQDGSINVNRNEELTLIFTPNDFSNPYYSDLTGEKGESFSILTALQETTNNTDLFAGAKTFNWKEKSYELKYTPTTSDVTLKAVFTPSHIVHVHVTGGTAKVKDTTGLVTKESGAGQFQHVIVKNNGTVELELKDTTGTATTYKQAYWSNVDGSDDTIVSNQAFTGNGPSYTYTTRAVGKPRALNITFEEGQTVDVKVTHGTLVTGNDGVAWNDKGNSTYQTIVKNNGALKVNIKPEDGYGLKSITVNNVAIDIDAAIKSGEITWDGTTKTYSHTFAKVYQAWNVTVDFEKLHEIVFEDQKGNILNKTEHITVIDGDTIPAASFTKMQEEADKSKAENESLFVWVDKTDSTKIYNETTVMTAQTADVVTLIPVYRMNVIKGADGSVIAADDFVIHVNDVRKLTDTEAATLANVTAYDHSGSDISNRVTVEQTKLEELKKKTKGTYVDALTFMIAASGLTTGVEVEVTDDNPTITGKTAYTLTFKGRANETYKYQELDAQGTPTGNVSTILTDGDGKATITGLKKATPYQISHKKYGSVNGKTALVDAKDIAKQFEDRGAGDTTGNNATDRTEKAENSNVQVVVDADGNYKVIVKKDIDHTVEIPDTWGEVKIDLNDKTITGDKADDNNEAKPGLEFVKDANSNEHPGTNLEIVNGTIKGGDGSAKHPDGAAGIGASGDTADAGIIIGNNANVTGGNGANGTEGTDGGNGGAGIDGNGKLTPTVSGTVTGGNGGKGGDSVAGIPGNGGNGGTGISAGDKTITINPGGTVKGGDAGNGGNATGDNTNPGGNGGNGGTGTETTQPGKTDNNGGTTSGGNGGDGGKSDNGNGGNGGNGGSGSTGESNNNGGTNSGGNGGNGGDSDKGNGGSGGNGGSSGETGGNGGNNTGGNGGNGGDSNNGNGGSGGNGGESNSGTGGNGGNGGDSNNGTGGNGGNGGESNSGNGGNGGDGGNGKNPGTGGNGGGSNSGNNGSSGSDGNRPGGNGGNNNGSGGNNGSNNGGNNSGNNGGNSNGNTNGTNTGVTDGKTNATDIAAADGNNASGGNKNNKHNRNNRNNNESDQADGEDVTEGTETGADTGSDDTTDVTDSTETGADADGSGNADDSIPADSSDADGHISFADCGSHWYPVILILVIAGYTVLRIRKIREELDGE